ncbi:hypothetical protein DRE_02235 [Drechslerella stenobrocha 248]|uniref:Zn(2)-C6 fungal-type domain-containing protein n=1 Tax=Drechslerella stenobrocha 248 TaxID=1043628 RepID=W7HWF4_9PEZI|nr:hypothetical protein DRE_02235 [Drechslerella stenobrocha 248]
MEKPPGNNPKMRSSIACARCRKSKVKCLNNGVNTTCRACEATGRECTYPPPAVPGSASQAHSHSGSAGLSATGPYSSPTSALHHGAANGIHALLGPELKARPRPKKPSTGPQGPYPSAGQTVHLRDGSHRPLSEALDTNVLTPTVWSGIYDLLTMHYPHLPILHRPTFLRPLTEAPSDAEAVHTATPPANSTSATSPPSPSPFLLLAVLMLTARFSAPLIQYHNTTAINTSEYYATALRSKLMTLNPTAGDPDDDGFLTPSLAKVQSLIMLAVHELGQSHGQNAWQWLGIAVKMCQLLKLPPRSPNLVKGWIAEESERRTWWAVVMLDRMLSNTASSGGRSFTYGWERVRGVPLPCSERSWLFSERITAGVLDTPILATATPSLAIRNESSGLLKNGVTEGGEVVEFPKEEESVHARLIRLVDIWGRVAIFLCNPDTSLSTAETLGQELERWKAELPKSLAYSHKNLSAHIAERSSSSYALLHIIYFMSILLLHRESLPVLPTLNAPSTTPNKCFSAARKITEIAREMTTWFSLPLTPIICFAIYSTAWVGTYGLHYPHMTGPPGNGMGSGDARFLLCVIESWRSKWHVADGWVQALGSLHNFLRRKRKAAEVTDMASSRKRRRSVGSDDIGLPEPRPATPGADELATVYNEEMKAFNKTITGFLTLSLGSSGDSARDGHRQTKRSKSHVGSSAGGGSDTEMTNAPPTSAPIANMPVTVTTSNPGDSWVAVNTMNRQDPGRALHGLLAAAQAGENSREAQLFQRPESSSSVPASQSASQPSWNAVETTTPRKATPQSLPDRVSPESHSTKAEHASSSPILTVSGSQPIRAAESNGDGAATAAPATATSWQGAERLAAAQEVTMAKHDSPSESSDIHEKDVVVFAGWGPLGLAKIDLVGFCEGKPWEEWACGQPGWFEAGPERSGEADAE